MWLNKLLKPEFTNYDCFNLKDTIYYLKIK